jgi:flavodoxin I
MQRTGIFYGSSTGDTEFVAKELQKSFGSESATVHNIIAVDPDDFKQYDLIILGTSTWREAGLQYDWDFFLDLLDEVDLSKKRVAIYGLGDQKNYPANFADAMRVLYDKVVEKGATVIGAWPSEGYRFEASKALIDGKFLGLVIDELNQHNLTATRIEQWVKSLG